MKLILASTSPYRAELLQRLQVNFDQRDSGLKETPIAGEPPAQRAARLAREKAQAVAAQVAHPSLIIGSDQVASINQDILSKPGSLANAKAQLQASSGKTGHFYTACCVLNSETGQLEQAVDTVTVHFRQLSEQQIDRYLELEQPLYCAGSFKIEGLGISLMQKVHCDDPTSLVGLGLISLCNLLQKHNFAIPGQSI